MIGPFVPATRHLVTGRWLHHIEGRTGPKSFVPQKSIRPDIRPACPREAQSDMAFVVTSRTSV
jgi:hypothetical protein